MKKKDSVKGRYWIGDENDDDHDCLQQSETEDLLSEESKVEREDFPVEWLGTLDALKAKNAGLEDLEEAGAVPVTVKEFEGLKGEEKERWTKAIQEGLAPFDELGAVTKMSLKQAQNIASLHGKKVKQSPGRMVLVKKPLHDGLGGWKPKARVVCCGNFEEGTFGGDVKNRAEVPGGTELRLLLALAAREGYSIAGLDVKNAFLHAPLSEEEKGSIWVKPPQFLVRLGLSQPDEVWQLHKAMYGLRSAP